MSWFYVSNHIIVGPVSADTFDQLLKSGAIGHETLVWREGLKGWLPWGTLTPPVQRAADLEEVATRGRTTPVGTLWTQAWTWFQREPWALMGWMTVTGILLALLSLGGLGLGLLIPFAGSLIGVFLGGPLATGILFMLLERWRGGPLELGTIFRVFGPRYWPLVVGQMVQQSVMLAVTVVILAGLGPMLVTTYLIWKNPEIMPPEVALAVVLGGAVVGLAGLFAYFYLAVAWLYAPLLILDRGLDFWPAMQLSRRVANRHPWNFSWFLLVVSTFAMVGGLACGIGLVFTATLAAQMLVIAYDRLLGDLLVPPAA